MTVLDSSGMRSSALLFARIYEQSRDFVFFSFFPFFLIINSRNSITEGMIRREIGGKRALELWLRDLEYVYLNPSFLYPAASAYQ